MILLSCDMGCFQCEDQVCSVPVPECAETLVVGLAPDPNTEYSLKIIKGDHVKLFNVTSAADGKISISIEDTFFNAGGGDYKAKLFVNTNDQVIIEDSEGVQADCVIFKFENATGDIPTSFELLYT